MFEKSLIESHRAWWEWLERARQKTQEALALDPGWSLTNTIKAQLDFMESCVANGRSPTKEEALRVTLGVIAMRNLEDSCPDYALLLQEVGYAFKYWDKLPET